MDDGIEESFDCPAGHRAPRAYEFDGKAVFAFEDDVLVHWSAGALVQQGEGSKRQTLLFLRRRFPLLYTIPAGHVEQGSEPEDEMRREVLEETGLVVGAALRLWPAFKLEDPCRRGADWHHWHVYRAFASGQPRLSEEGRILGWYQDGEVAELAGRGLLALPVRAILERAGVIPSR